MAGGTLGVAILDPDTDEVAGHRLDERFQMCSTFKALAVAAVLDRIDRGLNRPERLIRYSRSALLPYASVTKKHLKEA